MNQGGSLHSNSAATGAPPLEQLSSNRLVTGTSVQGRLVLLVSAITVVGLLSGVLIALTAYQNEKAAVIGHLSRTARAISSAVDMYVRELETLLKTLAASSELAQTNFAAFHRLCANVVTNEDTWMRPGSS